MIVYRSSLCLNRLMLIDENVEVVLANELGIGASELLKQHNVTIIPVKPGTNVEDAY